jgi:catechol 2,3-dioxygenase-like lactoylglutathione lyase family enzyme
VRSLPLQVSVHHSLTIESVHRLTSREHQALHSGQHGQMIYGSHVVLLSRDAEADRAFLADVLGFDHVDAGGGWLIFGLPPAEAAVHPSDAPGSELYFMCDDLVAEMRALAEKGAQLSEVEEARWGSVTKIRLPGGGEVGLYQPRHAAMVTPS